MNLKKRLQKATEYIGVFLLAVLSSVNYQIFIFPNSFAPAGIDGICTMIQDISKINMGYLSLLVNLPLLFASFFVLDQEFSIKTALYTVSFSLTTVFLKQTGLHTFAYYTETGTSIVLAPLAAGVIRGLLYVLTLKLHASSGGTDIIAGLVKKKYPYFQFMNLLFVMNLIIAFSSYFVYGMKPEPVICSILYAFLTTTVTNRVQKKQTETVKFEIITDSPDTLCREITEQLHTTATVMEARGGYSGKEKAMVICVTEHKKEPQLEALLASYPEAVIFKSKTSRQDLFY